MGTRAQCSRPGIRNQDQREPTVNPTPPSFPTVLGRFEFQLHSGRATTGQEPQGQVASSVANHHCSTWPIYNSKSLVVAILWVVCLVSTSGLPNRGTTSRNGTTARPHRCRPSHAASSTDGMDLWLATTPTTDAQPESVSPEPRNTRAQDNLGRPGSENVNVQQLGNIITARPCMSPVGLYKSPHHPIHPSSAAASSPGVILALIENSQLSVA